MDAIRLHMAGFHETVAAWNSFDGKSGRVVKAICKVLLCSLRC